MLLVVVIKNANGFNVLQERKYHDGNYDRFAYLDAHNTILLAFKFGFQHYNKFEKQFIYRTNDVFYRFYDDTCDQWSQVTRIANLFPCFDNMIYKE